MGVWGAGLYSGDYALDLRTTVGALARLPFDADKLLDLLSESEPAANNPQDEEYGTFWLVVADQFAKRGLASDRARDTALGIIDEGRDLAAQQKLGMKAADLEKRRMALETLRSRIVEAPAVGKIRKVLAKPQPLVMETGDVVVYPTAGGKCINPYFASKEVQKWQQDGWAAMTIVDSGRAFGFLSWYHAVTLAEGTAEKPTLESLRGELLWRLGSPGTCSTSQFRKMELEKIGNWPVDVEQLNRVFPGLRSGDSAAMSDISISNSMSAAPYVSRHVIPKPGAAPRGFAPVMLGIEQILRK
jgi:hypothetical protein